MRKLYRLAFRALCAVGAPVGGLRPHRMYHWLAGRAYPDGAGDRREFRWHRDRWGHRFLVHPFYHIDRQIIVRGGYELPLLQFLAERVRPGMVCADIGANLGQITVHLGGLVSPGGCVHAFEPVPEVRARLEEHVRENGLANGVVVSPIALSNENGVATFHALGAGAANQGMGSLATDVAGAGARTFDVETLRLDDYVERHGIDRLDWVKMDVQGAEPLVLEGGLRALAALKPDLVLEVSAADLRSLGKSGRDLLQQVEDLGYRMVDLSLGRSGKRLRPADVPPDFDSEFVHCTHESKAPA